MTRPWAMGCVQSGERLQGLACARAWQGHRSSVLREERGSNRCPQMNPGGTSHHSANRLALQATRYAFLFYDLDDGPLVFEFPTAEAGGFW